MTPTLLSCALVRRDYDHRRISRGRAGNHILQELLVAGRVDDRESAILGPKMDLGGVDGDVLLLLLRQRIEDESVLEPPAVPLTRRPNCFQFSFGKRVRRLEDPPNHRRFSMVDMSDEDK